jgi:hypothetical protein
MIKATVLLSTMFIDRPKKLEILLDPTAVAVQYMNEVGEKKEVTVGQLFNLYKRGKVYYTDGSDPETQITPDMFEQWFYARHLKENSLMQRLISVTYEYIK